MPSRLPRLAGPWARRVAGAAVVVLGVGYLVRVADAPALARVAQAVLADPPGLAAALAAFAAAFGLRTLAWPLVLPALGRGQAWAALHVSLLGNHVLPLRLGEALRVTSVLRRTDLAAAPVVASAVVLRLGDLLAVGVLAALAAPHLAGALVGSWGAVAATIAVVALAAGLVWVHRLGARGRGLRLPGARVAALVGAAWLFEAAVVWQVAHAAGIVLSPLDAVAVTAATIAAQSVAVTPGGVGGYEAAATAALTMLGTPAGPALAVAVVTHGLKTAYSLVVGTVALTVPAPGYWGRLRLPRRLPPRPERSATGPDAPVVAVVPARDEESSVGEVVERLPRRVAGHPVVALVVDDGSRDRTAARASAAGARVVRMGANAGLGAALRRGFAEASALRPAAVGYLDADGEYAPEDLPRVLAPVLAGRADYVVGSRFARGRPRRMRPHRRFGNALLTGLLRWLTRRRDLTDGQSGLRGFSAAAAAHAEIVHDYNYAQVLTLDLLGKGYAYAEVPVGYRRRRAGRSFVRPLVYLRRVLPAIHRELNLPDAPAPARPSAGPASVLDHVPREALAGG
ncbi:MAG: lysylphosphatidylglycerol synthase domain-containing protein [Mycobacterium leprae]